MFHSKKLLITLFAALALLCSTTTTAIAAPSTGSVEPTTAGTLDPADGIPITEAPLGIASAENCANIGNGDVCIRVGANNGQYGDITVWFSKHAGSQVTVRLRYSRGDESGEDDGAFAINAGEVRGYIWPNRYLYTGCYYSQLRTGPAPYYGVIIYGGSVCI